MKKFFVVTFLGSIIWIAAYSYLMVWWATVAGKTIGIPDTVSKEKKGKMAPDRKEPDPHVPFFFLGDGSHVSSRWYLSSRPDH